MSEADDDPTLAFLDEPELAREFARGQLSGAIALTPHRSADAVFYQSKDTFYKLYLRAFPREAALRVATGTTHFRRTDGAGTVAVVPGDWVLLAPGLAEWSVARRAAARSETFMAPRAAALSSGRLLLALAREPLTLSTMGPSAAQVDSALVQVLLALVALRGEVSHNDLQPSNILIRPLPVESLLPARGARAFPSAGVLARVTDFDCAAAWRVGARQAMLGRTLLADEYAPAYEVPNFPCPEYDAVYLVASLSETFRRVGAPMLSRAMAFVFEGNPRDHYNTHARPHVHSGALRRPPLAGKTAEAILAHLELADSFWVAAGGTQGAADASTASAD